MDWPIYYIFGEGKKKKKKTLESKTHDALKSTYNIFDQTICEESFKNSALTEESRIA